MQVLFGRCGYFGYDCRVLFREGVKENPFILTMIIPGRGGGGFAGGDHTLLGFFNAPNLVVWLY